jgi:hypothetical protein
MPQSLDSIVRPFQLPTNTTPDLYLTQTGQPSQAPITIRAGQSAGSPGSIRSFTANFNYSQSLYMDQAAVEQ